MWVKLTLPPWRRRRCPLSTLRLTSSSRAGTVRTEVAVGTCPAGLHRLHDPGRRPPQRHQLRLGLPVPLGGRLGPGLLLGLGGGLAAGLAVFGRSLAAGSLAGGASWGVGGAAASRGASPPSASTRPSAVSSSAAASAPSSPGSFSAKKSRQAGLTDSGLSRYCR